MGVDARIYVKNFGPRLNEIQIRTLAGNMCAAVGAEHFWIDVKRNQHALEEVEEFMDDGPPIIASKDVQFLSVNTFKRYYGIEYSRGDWPSIRAIISYLKHYFPIPHGEVWYGGDSSGCSAELMTDQKLAEIDDHFNSQGHDAYNGVFGKDRESAKCSFCGDRQMANHGGGGGDTYLSCHGCGRSYILTSKGSLHRLEEKEDFFKAHSRIKKEVV